VPRYQFTDGVTAADDCTLADTSSSGIRVAGGIHHRTQQAEDCQRSTVIPQPLKLSMKVFCMGLPDAI
jgi:hypothetical protein